MAGELQPVHSAPEQIESEVGGKLQPEVHTSAGSYANGGQQRRPRRYSSRRGFHRELLAAGGWIHVGCSQDGQHGPSPDGHGPGPECGMTQEAGMKDYPPGSRLPGQERTPATSSPVSLVNAGRAAPTELRGRQGNRERVPTQGALTTSP